MSLMFSYFGIFTYPLEAVHQYGGDESQHGGLWRGVYDHKNVASAVMAIFAMIGIFVWRTGYRMLGLAIATMAMVFLLNSGSKTSVALLPVAIFYAIFIGKLTSPILRFVSSLLPLGILFTITVGSAVIDPNKWNITNNCARHHFHWPVGSVGNMQWKELANIQLLVLGSKIFGEHLPSRMQINQLS